MVALTEKRYDMALTYHT